jgi:hypothetical protein
MYERGHDNSYRAAFNTASAELNEVYREFEQLRVRKEKVEKVIDALKPLVGGQNAAWESSAAPVSSEPAQYYAEPQAAVPAPARQDASASVDAVQRRIDGILGLAVA